MTREYPGAFDEIIDAPKPKPRKGATKTKAKPEVEAEPASAGATTTAGGPVGLADFVAYMPQHSYIFRASGEMWPARASMRESRRSDVGGDKPLPASVWLDRNQPVEQMTWAPGMPTEITRPVGHCRGLDRPSRVHGLQPLSTAVPSRPSRRRMQNGSITSRRSIRTMRRI